MTKYVIVSLVTGVLFGVLDGVINANPLARSLFAVYRPIARTSVNAPVGVAIDLAYGFVMTGLFLVLFKSLPGGTGLVRGVSFALLIWFFRVVMGVAGEWMTLDVPAGVHVYRLLTGLGEMLALGVLLGLAFRGQTAMNG